MNNKYVYYVKYLQLEWLIDWLSKKQVLIISFDFFLNLYRRIEGSVIVNGHKANNAYQVILTEKKYIKEIKLNLDTFTRRTGVYPSIICTC